MTKKHKIIFGSVALMMFCTATIVEDFVGDLGHLIWGLLILVLLVALTIGCFRWNLTDKKNTETKAEGYNRNFWMINKKQLICVLCTLIIVTIVTIVRVQQSGVHMRQLTDPFIIGTILVIAPVFIVCVRLFRDKKVEESEDEQKR